MKRNGYLSFHMINDITGVCDAISLFDAVCVGLSVTVIISKKELATSVLNFRLE